MLDPCLRHMAFHVNFLGLALFCTPLEQIFCGQCVLQAERQKVGQEPEYQIGYNSRVNQIIRMAKLHHHESPPLCGQ
jgi:hypothetical protein